MKVLTYKNQDGDIVEDNVILNRGISITKLFSEAGLSKTTYYQAKRRGRPLSYITYYVLNQAMKRIEDKTRFSS